MSSTTRIIVIVVNAEFDVTTLLSKIVASPEGWALLAKCFHKSEK